MNLNAKFRSHNVNKEFHFYRISPYAMGKCVCGNEFGWRNHQSALWRKLHPTKTVRWK